MSQLIQWYLLLVKNKSGRGEISVQLAFKRTTDNTTAYHDMSDYQKMCSALLLEK